MINQESFNKLARELEEHHGIFSQLWQMGKPLADKTIPTACVRFDKKGGYFGFYFNPVFYNSLDDYNRKFVICHEALHIILNHGARMMGHEPDLSNKAADVVINETLVKQFGFKRELIQNHQDYCWLDTVFNPTTFKHPLGSPHTVARNQSYEYYYDLLKQDQDKQAGKSQPGKPQAGTPQSGASQSGPRTVDQHEGFGADAQDQVDDKINEACDNLSAEEVEKLAGAISSALDDETKKNLQAGLGAGNLVKQIGNIKVVKKKKWETVIRRWSQKYLKYDEKALEQWARINRRFVTLSGSDIFIPSEMEMEAYADKKSRIRVMFFLDTSGSCAHLAERFWKAAASLPEERFDIQLCCFDTQVYETNLASRKLYGFGGTSFRCIERYILEKTKSKQEPYPKAVFVITDGYGDSVAPLLPQNWYWFLSENYTGCIPKTSKTFMLKDYE